MTITGKLKQLHEVKDTGKFKSRKVWITTEENPQYPQTIELELNQGNIDKCNNIAVGAPCTFHINLRGREWTGDDGVTKVFNTLVCWKVESAAGYVAPAAAGQAAPVDSTTEPKDDLPF